MENTIVRSTTRVDVREAKRARDVLELAQLNYRVATVPLTAMHGELGVPVTTGHQAVVRTDTGQTLGVVGSRYTPVQTVDFLDAMEPVVREHGLRYVSVMSIDGGRLVALELQLPEPIVLKYNGHEDVLLRRIIYRNSHDGTSQLLLWDALLRQWCKNGATHVLGMSGQAVRHTMGASIKVPALVAGVGAAQARFKRVAEKINLYARQPFTLEQMERMAIQLVPTKVEPVPYQTYYKREELKKLYAGGQGTFGRTAWDALNAVSEHLNHHRGVRSGDPATARLRGVLLHESDLLDQAEAFIDAEYKVVS